MAPAIAMIVILWSVGTVTPALAQHEGHGGAQQAPPQSKEQQPKEQVKSEEGGTETPTVEIPLDKQQMIGVRTVPVAIHSFRKAIRTVGRVEYDERTLAAISPRFEGWIEKLFVDYTGMQVKKGDPLAEVYSPELFATQQELINVLRWKDDGGARNDGISRMLVKDNEAVAEAARERLRLMGISDEQIKEIENTGRALRTITLKSPVDGTVIQKAAVQGMRFMPGDKLFDIADLSVVWVQADVYEYDLPLIRVGETASISLSYLPGRTFSARVEYVSPVLASDTRTAKARFSLPNPGGRLKPQMFTDVELKVGVGSGLAIPEDAVIDTGERRIVYVDKGEGFFEPREITTGTRADGMVEVLKGLKPKERVATSANFLIDSEARLKGVVK